MSSNEEKTDRKSIREAKRQQKLMNNAARDLRRMMLKYPQDERFAESLAAALPLYWDSYYDIHTADEMSQNEALRFYDWFLFDYQHEGQPRLIEQFAEEKRDTLNDNQAAVLEGWLTAPAATAFEFIDFDDFNSRFKLKEWMTGEELTVFSSGGKGVADKGDLILNRVVPIGSELAFSTVGAFIPNDEIGDLGETLTAEKEGMGDVSHDEFMRKKGILVIHHALSQAVEHGRFAVTRLDPNRVDLAARRTVKKVVKKIRRR